jgi:type I restriction enzyme S subunit
MENGEWKMSDDKHSQFSTLNFPLIPPGYKQTEVGVIPEDWEVKQIQEVCGFIVPGRNKPRVFDGNIPWITTPDLEDGRTVYESRSMLRVSISEAKAVGSKVVPAGSVVMSCVGELGIVALAGCDIVINQQLHAFLPSAAINRAFLAYAIKSQAAYIDRAATKTALPYLNKDNCNSIPIPVPPLPEQEAIAEALSDADALIESLEQLIAKKRQIKQGAMQELLTVKKRLPWFSREWKIKPLRELCHSIVDGTHFTPRYVEIGIPFYSVENVTANDFVNTKFISTQEHNQLIKRCKPEKGDILITRIGSVGNTKLIDWDVEASIYVSLALLKVNDLIDARYLHCYSKCRQFVKDMEDRSLMNASPKKINMGDIGDVPVPIPELSEQTAIAAILSDMDAEVAALEEKLAKARQLKQGMMQELLTGRIRLV